MSSWSRISPSRVWDQHFDLRQLQSHQVSPNQNRGLDKDPLPRLGQGFFLGVLTPLPLGLLAGQGKSRGGEVGSGSITLL